MAETLRGPRIYSTDLFPALLDTSDPAASVEVTARALKVKIITKGLVTLNAAYLLSPLAVHLFDRFPDLLDGPAVLPAFRDDKDALSDLLLSNDSHQAAGIDDIRLRDHVARVDGSIKQVMPWTLGGVADRFRSVLLDGLSYPHALIVRELASAGLGEADVARIVADIGSLDLSNSVTLRNYAATLPEAARTPFNRFQAACYHMVGTAVVRCEAGTDLNPLSAFRAADLILAARDSEPEALSEEAIFIEAFMGFALDTIQAAALPTQILDSLSFADVHQLSEALRKQGFQDKYDGIVRQYLTAAGLPDGQEALAALDSEQIAHVAAALAQEFQANVLDELSNYQTVTQEMAQAQVIQARADIAKDFANAVPGLGSVISVADGVQHTAKAITAGKEMRNVRELSAALIKSESNRVMKIQQAIDRLKVEKKTRATLLDAVGVLSDVHGIAIARA